MKWVKNLGIPMGFIVGYYLFGTLFTFAFRDRLLATILADIFVVFICFFYLNAVKYSDTFKQYPTSKFNLFIFVSFFIIWFSDYITNIWFFFTFTDPSMNDRISTINSSNIYLYYLLSILVAPICEELIFRGIVYRHFRNIMPFEVAALISSFLFAFMHGTKTHLISATIFSIFVSFVYQSSGKLYLAIIIHCLDNLLSVLASFIIFPSFIYTTIFVMLIGVASLLCIVYVYMAYNKHCKLSKEERSCKD